MAESTTSRISVLEIANRLAVGRTAVYEMLERNIIPNIRLGHRWIITRYAYEHWEQTCGTTTVVPMTPRETTGGV
jgi:excisionase family DNA binding protein